MLLPNIDPLVDPGEAVEAIRRGYLTEAKFLPRQALTVGDVWFAPMALSSSSTEANTGRLGYFL